MFDYVLNGTCVISLQFSRVEFTANHEFVPATFHCERKNKSSVILKPVSCVMFPISYNYYTLGCSTLRVTYLPGMCTPRTVRKFLLNRSSRI